MFKLFFSQNIYTSAPSQINYILILMIVTFPSSSAWHLFVALLLLLHFFPFAAEAGIVGTILGLARNAGRGVSAARTASHVATAGRRTSTAAGSVSVASFHRARVPSSTGWLVGLKLIFSAFLK
jgi:hypothetical protein